MTAGRVDDALVLLERSAQRIQEEVADEEEQENGGSVKRRVALNSAHLEVSRAIARLRSIA